MAKAFRKVIMTRSRLKNVYLKNQNTTNWNNYKHQQNFCTNLRWKPFFSNKGLASSNIVFKEKGNLITENQKLANLFNTYFINITDLLQLKKLPLKVPSLSKIISFYENHDSISKIKENNIIPKEFSIKAVTSKEVENIKSLIKKICHCCIPVSFLIGSMDIYFPLLLNIINDSLKRGTFPVKLKLSEVIPYSKKVIP